MCCDDLSNSPTALRMRALTLSMLLVVHTIRRISASNCRKGVNSAQLVSQRRTIAGYFFPQTSANSRNLVVAASSVGAV